MTYTCHVATGSGSTVGYYEKEVYKHFSIETLKETRSLKPAIKTKLVKPLNLDALCAALNKPRFAVLKKELRDIMFILEWAGWVKSDTVGQYHWIHEGKRKDLS